MQLENQLRTEIELLQDFIDSRDPDADAPLISALRGNMQQAESELAALADLRAALSKKK